LFALTGGLTAHAVPPAADPMSYLVIIEPGTGVDVGAAVIRNGGTIHASYDRIGVTVARSTDASFGSRMRAVRGVSFAGATRTTAVSGQVPETDRTMREPTFDIIDPAADRDGPTETVEWDMKAIGADKAWTTGTGSRDVLVGVIDTGVDDTHEDLSANFDAANSASCVGGKADNRAGAWRVTSSDHGTHVAGTIAAAKNGKGVIGVAPGVRVAALKIDEGGKGMLYAENVVCAFMYAAEKKMAVTNNSYYVDPWMFNCPDDPDQAAIAEGIRRAMSYSEQRGVANVVAAGNGSTDLAAVKRVDSTSPNDSIPRRRDLTNKCLMMPQEVSGVTMVSASDSGSRKALFSNYGLNKIDVVSPGVNIRSTVPGNKYGSKSGTSMASPHVAGVMALLASKNKGACPAMLKSLLRRQAIDWPCAQHGGGARCTGPDGDNSFFGEGLSDAEKAVTQ
jgi:subtilisin family serine protease